MLKQNKSKLKLKQQNYEKIAKLYLIIIDKKAGVVAIENTRKNIYLLVTVKLRAEV